MGRGAEGLGGPQNPALSLGVLHAVWGWREGSRHGAGAELGGAQSHPTGQQGPLVIAGGVALELPGGHWAGREALSFPGWELGWERGSRGEPQPCSGAAPPAAGTWESQHPWGTPSLCHGGCVSPRGDGTHLDGDDQLGPTDGGGLPPAQFPQGTPAPHRAGGLGRAGTLTPEGSVPQPCRSARTLGAGPGTPGDSLPAGRDCGHRVPSRGQTWHGHLPGHFGLFTCPRVCVHRVRNTSVHRGAQPHSVHWELCTHCTYPGVHNAPQRIPRGRAGSRPAVPPGPLSPRQRVALELLLPLASTSPSGAGLSSSRSSIRRDLQAPLHG